jgi:hypothetical protein
VKIHTLLDLKSSIPTFVSLTPGNVHDVTILDTVPFKENSIVTMDSAYIDFGRLYAIHRLPAFFVIRAKQNLRYHSLTSRKVDKGTGLRADQTIFLTCVRSRILYPEASRRVSYVDLPSWKAFSFCFSDQRLQLARTGHCSYLRIMMANRAFFQWIKQHLRTKTFYGTSDNALKTQV